MGGSMKSNILKNITLAAAGSLTLLAVTLNILNAQAPAPGGRCGGRGGAIAPASFTALDANKDGSVTRDEIKAAFDDWYTNWDTAKSGALAQDQLVTGLTAAFPPPAPPDYVGNMMAALPTAPGAKPL